jgi:hypothetical protein
MTTTVTPRISGAPAQSSTRRVATSSASGGTPASLGSDSWGNSWGFTASQPSRAWGRSWLTAAAATAGTGQKPEGTPTPRVAGAPSSTVTKRVTL